MILFITLLLTLISLTAFTVISLAVGGASMIIVFGDVIVCAVLIVFICKKFIKKKE